MRAIALFCLLSTSCWAAQKIEIEIVSSKESTQYYDIPARLGCVPGTLGPTCAARGAETRAVGFVQMNARVNGVDVTLTCDSHHEKNCTRFQAGKYMAEPKGKDQLVLFGWNNPIYRGDYSKATKVKFRIGAFPGK